MKMGGMTHGSSGWSFGRVSGSVVLVAIVAIVNVLAFLGALRYGILYYRLPMEAGAASDLSDSWVNQSKSTCNPLPESSPSLKVSSPHDSAFEYPVCVILAIGDDTSFPNDKAFPYSELYRLFDATKEELSKVFRERTELQSSTSPVKLLVGVDYTSVVCKIIRDTLQDSGGQFMDVELTCQNLEDAKKQSDTLASTQAVGMENTMVKCGTAIVGDSSRYVTQLTLAWAHWIRWDRLRVVDLDKPDPSRAVPAIPRAMWRPTVATAFSGNHFVVGCLLLRSVAQAGKEIAAAGHFNLSVIVFTLEEFNSTMQGILDCLIREMNEDYKIPTEVRLFDFDAHPPWMRIDQWKNYNGGFGEYAWKVVMIHEVIVERGFLFWLDAGGRVSFEPLMISLNYTRDNGFANRGTVGFVPQYVHKGMIKYLRYVVKYKPARVHNCDGSAIGLTLDKYNDIARPWYDCSQNKQCIAPDGSGHHNHRQDQAALTLIADMSGSPCSGVSMKLKRHMDTHLNEHFSGTPDTKCYRDPLQIVAPPMPSPGT